MNIPREIRELMIIIKDAGHEVYLVGGCIRDSILGIKPKDYDLCTSATIDVLTEILALHYNTFQVGKQFATLIVHLKEMDVEVSSFRRRTHEGIKFGGSEGKCEDRFEDNLDDNLEMDLMCRDFTINAIAQDVDGVYFDPFSGKQDLSSRLLRSIEPDQIMEEDPLRALRAIRLKLKYRLNLDEGLKEAIKRIASAPVAISPERLRDELFKILLLENPSEAIRDFVEYGLIKWFPFHEQVLRMVGYDQENPYHDKSLFDHTMAVLDHTPRQIEIRLAALFHDICKPDVQTFDEVAHYYGHEKLSGNASKSILKNLNCSNKLIHNVSLLIEAHMFSPTDIGEKGIKRLINKVGSVEQMYMLLNLMEADIKGTAFPERSSCIQPLRFLVMRLEEEKTVFKRTDLQVSGKDLINLGILEGRLIGKVLAELLEAVMSGEVENDKEQLLEFIHVMEMKRLIIDEKVDGKV